jgi:hypothetical protein
MKTMEIFHNAWELKAGNKLIADRLQTTGIRINILPCGVSLCCVCGYINHYDNACVLTIVFIGFEIIQSIQNGGDCI